MTRLLKPVIWAILSKSWPSGLESIWKLACKICTCSSVKVVRILLVFFLVWLSESPLSKISNMVHMRCLFCCCTNVNLNTYHRTMCSLRQSFPCNAPYKALDFHWCQILRLYLIVFCRNRRRNRPSGTPAHVLFVPNRLAKSSDCIWNIWLQIIWNLQSINHSKIKILVRQHIKEERTDVRIHIRIVKRGVWLTWCNRFCNKVVHL